MRIPSATSACKRAYLSIDKTGTLSLSVVEMKHSSSSVGRFSKQLASRKEDGAILMSSYRVFVDVRARTQELFTARHFFTLPVTTSSTFERTQRHLREPIQFILWAQEIRFQRSRMPTKLSSLCVILRTLPPSIRVANKNLSRIDSISNPCLLWSQP